MTLKIPEDLYQQMLAHCVQGLPNEACGFLGGRDGEAQVIYPLTNEAASPVYYRPAGREMLAAMNDLDERGIELAAIFHSHVASPPRPSPTDVREAHYPEAVYIIVSLADQTSPEVMGWRIVKDDWTAETGEIEQVPLVIS